MTEQESKNLITETFENDFNRARFKRFIANLLTEYQEVSILTDERYIKDAYKRYVKSYEVIAKFIDSEKRTLDVLITYLKTESTFTARTRQRNFALDYLKSKNRDGVLIAYVHENKKDWRFSFVKLENDVVKGEDGRVKDISSFTAAKRSSFLVGSNENSYTAKKQFLPIIQKEDQPKFEDIEEAFSVETVTKEFFEKYRELFHDVHDALEAEIKGKPQLKEEFEEKEVSTVDFAKKLLGQMVFLYFLQKKGWFGVKPNEDWGTGPKNFLRELFKAKDKYGKNFFNDVLEPLFYEALAQDRGRDSIYPRLNNCRMPFLNGGLFEPMRGYSWETTDIFLPDELFSNKNKDGEDIGDGILDVFDRYNFTVNESDPLEKEVAVDPEMLGKVFENLLDVKDRKSKGSFYTPREIVHYMCQECLINYLETETKGEVPREDIENLVLNGETIIQNDFVTLKKQREKEEKGYKYSGTYELKLPESIQKNARRIDNLLKNIKVCDPAVGSGAFPLGMINEIVGARQVLQVYLRDKLSVYDLKYHAIANSIHGVDIDPGAVDIARLRLWLSLIVEEKDPRPLPNLEHRIMQGNSLLSEYEGIQLFNRELLTKSGDEKFVQLGFVFGSGIKRKMEELERNIKIYVDTSQRSVKEKLKESIDELRWELIEETLKEQGKLDKMEEIKKLREKSVRPFFVWELEFSEVFKEKGGFDVVIGNPPYISYYSKQSQSDAQTKNYLEYLKKKYNFIENKKKLGRFNSLMFFIELGFNILGPKKVLYYIVDNNIHSNPSKDIRKYILDNYTLLEIIDKINGFENVNSGQVIIGMKKELSSESHFIKWKELEERDFILLLTEYQNDIQILNDKSFKMPKPQEIRLLLNKIEEGNKGLADLLGKRNVRTCITFTGKKEDFVIKSKVKEIDYPLLEGASGVEFPYSNVKYTNFIRYDTDLRDELNEKYKKIAAGGNKRSPMVIGLGDLKMFKSPKIFVRLSAERLVATYTEEVVCADLSLYIITLPNLENEWEGISLLYILSIINSKLMSFFFQKKGYIRNLGIGTPQIRLKDLRTLPVKQINPSQQSSFVSLVQKIFSITNQKDYDPHNPSEEQKTLEKEIDQMVYQLYGLTKEEIELVEKSTKS